MHDDLIYKYYIQAKKILPRLTRPTCTREHFSRSAFFLQQLVHCRYSVLFWSSEGREGGREGRRKGRRKERSVYKHFGGVLFLFLFFVCEKPT